MELVDLKPICFSASLVNIKKTWSDEEDSILDSVFSFTLSSMSEFECYIHTTPSNGLCAVSLYITNEDTYEDIETLWKDHLKAIPERSERTAEENNLLVIHNNYLLLITI